MNTEVQRIDRCVRATLTHQRKKNRVDIFMILQRVDYKINRQKLGHKVVNEMQYTFANDIIYVGNVPNLWLLHLTSAKPTNVSSRYTA